MKPKFVFLFVLFSVIASMVRSQPGQVVLKVDSLENVLKSAAPQLQPDLLIQLSALSYEIDPGFSLAYVHKAEALPDSLISPEQLFQLNVWAARSLMAKGQKAAAMDYLKKARNNIDAFAGADLSPALREIELLMVNPAAIESDSRLSPIIRFSQYGTAILLVLVVFMGFLHWKLRKSNKRQLKGKRNELDALRKQLEVLEINVEKEIVKRTEALNNQLIESRQKDLELKKALKKAEDANYLKNAFLANMSHEIRTPLNGIIGFSSLLETELSMLENQELFEFAQGIQQSGDRLLHLLNNIIDISRIEAHDIEVELHPCNLNEIVSNISELHLFSANEKGLSFKSKTPEIPMVIADNSAITRIVNIVIENAIKYTNEGFVNILTGYQAETNEVFLRIKDTGVGMEADYMQHLFEAFRQESSGYSRSYQGAGLGLPLAKRLLDLMHGRIEINSTHAMGTTVEIFLPCQASEKQHTPLVEKPKPALPLYGSLDIFIVEDDRMNRLVLQKMLNKAGNTTIAVDGDETMKIISERHKKGHVFQVMLFDINLPSPWDGIKLMNKIRSEYKEYRFVPFIAQTAYAMAGDKEKMLEAGFDDYIAKPISKNELLTIIKNQLEKFKGLTAG